MTAPEFIINLIHKWGFVSKDSLATLNVQLSEGYIDLLNSFKNKENFNKDIMADLENKKSELDQIDEHKPEYAEKLFQFQKLQDKLEKPTWAEQAISLLHKPWVKLGLVIAFAIVSRWIAKKIIKGNDPDEDLDDRPSENQNQQYNQYPPNQGYYNYPPPPPNWGQFNQPRR